MHISEDLGDMMKQELVDAIHFLHNKGWAPATSSNYSFRQPGAEVYWISRSGRDKQYFRMADLMLINADAEPVQEPGAKSSAETLLHTLLYEHVDINCVLHTHTVNNSVLSLAHRQDGCLKIGGYEILKGLKGVATHEAEVEIPVFSNDQDMVKLSGQIRAYWDQHPAMPAFLLAGHGLYAWGSNIAEAKRHIETLEFLFECLITMKAYKG